MKNRLLLTCTTLLLCSSLAQAAKETNVPNDSGKEPTYGAHVLTANPTGIRLLYAPSQDDDAGYRAALAAELGGATVDYFDARVATPGLALLMEYDCVHTYADYAYFDNVAFGDVLADYVDQGGTVILGAFCTYTAFNFLSGRIMTPGYCPVVSPTGLNHFSSSSYTGDGTSCLHNGVPANGYSATYRDYLVTQGPGIQDGTFTDGEIATGYVPGYRVVYVNGSGGAPLDGGAAIAAVVANACDCSLNPVPVENTTWGRIKAIYE